MDIRMLLYEVCVHITVAKYAYMYDVLNNESIAAMINKVAEDLGGIYGLVNHCPGPEGRHL